MGYTNTFDVYIEYTYRTKAILLDVHKHLMYLMGIALKQYVTLDYHVGPW
jgi:hypothetical protein